MAEIVSVISVELMATAHGGCTVSTTEFTRTVILREPRRHRRKADMAMTP
jgi:hypothetical protein